MGDKAMRMLLPVNMNEDSTWTFVMFADPYYEGALYNIIPPLKQKYGEEDAEEVFSRWSDCFAEGQEIYLSKQNLILTHPLSNTFVGFLVCGGLKSKPRSRIE